MVRDYKSEKRLSQRETGGGKDAGHGEGGDGDSGNVMVR